MIKGRFGLLNLKNLAFNIPESDKYTNMLNKVSLNDKTHEFRRK